MSNTPPSIPTPTPEPPGFSSAPIRPKEAFYSEDLREYILPYDAVRTAGDPEQALMDFLISTYEAAANPGSGIAPRSNVHSGCREFPARSDTAHG